MRLCFCALDISSLYMCAMQHVVEARIVLCFELCSTSVCGFSIVLSDSQSFILSVSLAVLSEF